MPETTGVASATQRGGAVERIDQATVRASDLPLAQIADPAALALIRRTEGPSYRPPGAAMVFGRDGSVAGHLSSGCIDADIALHAGAVIAGAAPRALRYGRGSPFPDLILPCGGGLDIRILPVTEGAGIAALRAQIASRRPADLWVSTTGTGAAPFPGADLRLRILPDIRFIVFGKGPEAVAFSRMTAGAGYETFLSSPDPETLELAGGGPILPLPFPLRGRPADLPADRHTAVVLFFHDHDHEPAILLGALATEAFYIGAQGSRRTAENRREGLRRMGVDEAGLARLHGPMGLIPSTRDPRMLAVSVLAAVLAEAGAN